MNGPRLLLRCYGASIRAQMQYRASFVMLTLGQLINTAGEIVAVWVLFDRFGRLRSWRLVEVALFYGIINVAFSIGDAFARGFDTFDRMVKSGGFDRVLLRPRSAAVQIAGRQLLLTRLGRLTQGAAVLVWAAASLEVSWGWPHVLLLLWAIVGGACLFYGLFVLQATSAFWTVEALEIWNAFSYGGNEAAQYPLVIYADWFRRLFTFVVPLACVTYYPALLLLGREDRVTNAPPWLQAASPAVGMLFLAASMAVWRIGVRHYRSTGS